MLKKIIRISLIILLLYLFLEFLAMAICVSKYKENIRDAIKSGSSIKNLISIRMFNDKLYDKYYRQPIIVHNAKDGDIIIFGCSFGYGDGLENNQTFGYKLSQILHRNVYNRSDGGFGPQMMLYQIQSGKIAKLVKNANSIIYVYAADPEHRSLKYRCWPFLYKVSVRYKLMKDNSLKLQKISYLFAHSFIYRLIEEAYPKILGEEYCKKLFIRIIEESYIETQNLYPNSNFYILVYSHYNFPYKEQFEKMGIKVIQVKDLTNENLQNIEYVISEYNHHPNEKAWDLITHLFVKEAEMK